jgi:pyruvate dehydrogenase E2 component (dihydrolipoamide acetyltransferase)
VAAEVVMPRLGWTMETGTIAEWFKQDGDPVQSGEVLFAVETDKVAQEVEAQENGTLHILPSARQSGAVLPVGAVLAYLLQPGETAPAAEPAAGQDLAAPVVAVAPTSQQAAEPAPEGFPAISPRARRVARELGVDWRRLTGSGRTGRIRERDVRAAALQPEVSTPLRVTPLARRVAEQHGVDVAVLAAQRPGSRITRADVEAVAPGVAPREQAPVPAVATGQPLSPVRRTIAARMVQAARSVAPVTLTTEADATELVLVRRRIKEDLVGSDHPVPSYSDLFARLVALTVPDHPALNATFDGDRLLQHEAVHIGIAVDTDRGLLVPVVRDVQTKSVGAIAAESAELIPRAREGRCSLDELQGSTFTITNLGMYGIDAFTPIINVPECAILGIGRIVPKQVVTDAEAGTVAIRQMITLSLTVDHRVVDGAPAARFLQQIVHGLTHPYAWLTR